MVITDLSAAAKNSFPDISIAQNVVRKFLVQN